MGAETCPRVVRAEMNPNDLAGVRLAALKSPPGVSWEVAEDLSLKRKDVMTERFATRRLIPS